MFKELKVILSASIQKLKQGIKNAIGVVSGGERKIKQSADKINQSMNNAFGGDLRGNINKTNEKILQQKEELIKLQSKLNSLIAAQRNLKKGSDAYKDNANKIKAYRNQIRFATGELNELNTSLRDNKTNLANSRLAAEDNQSALESMSRTLTAVTGAVLLMDSENESLRNTMKVLNVTFAATNAVVSINNLRLRENQLFLKASAAASGLFSLATRNAAGSVSVLKTAISGLGIGALVTGLGYLVNSYLESSRAADKLKENQESLNDIQKEAQVNFLNQASSINSLTSVIDDSNQSLGTKESAYRELQKLVPSLTKLTFAEAKATGALTSQTQLQIKAIKARALAEAFSSAITEKTKQLIDAQNSTLNENVGIFEEIQNFSKGIFKFGIQNVSLTRDLSNLESGVKNKNEKISDIKQEIAKYQEQFTSALETALSIESKIFGFSESTAKSKEKQSKTAKQAVNEISKSLIAEERLRAEQEKKFLKTEEEKERAAIASEERILAIKRSSILQVAQAQNLSASQVTELLRNQTLEEIKLQNSKSARLQVARDKDTNAEINAYKLSYDQRKDLLEGSFAITDRTNADINQSLKKARDKDLITEKQYQSQLLVVEKEGLLEKLRALEASGIKDIALREKLKNQINKIEEKQSKNSVKNAEQTAVQIGSIVSREFGKVGRDIADALSDAFSSAFEQTSEMAELDIEILKKQNEELKYSLQDATKSQLEQLQAKKQLMENEAKILEKSQSNMSKLQSAMLVTVADFLESLGKGLIAAGLAVETFQKSLASNPLLAVAAGVAAVAAAAFVRSKINKGVAFADGGIVSGPTLGLVGEYPGASTNPEVIAPLDKLKNMIGGGMSEGGYIAETRVSGRDLALVLSRYEKDRTRG